MLPSFLPLRVAAHALPAARRRQLITSVRAGGHVGPAGSILGERTPSFISHPGGECRSAAFHSAICRWVRCTRRSRLVLFGGSLRSMGLAFIFLYKLYLASSIGVPGFWPYSAQKKDSPTSRRFHRMSSSLPRTWKSPGKYPASRTLRADTLPLLNGKDVVSQPVKACIPSNRRHLEHSLVHVWLMSCTAPAQRTICIWHLSTSWFLHIQNTRSTNTSVSPQNTRTTFFP